MGPDLFENFVNITNQYRRKNGLPSNTYTLTSKTNLPGNALYLRRDRPVIDPWRLLPTPGAPCRTHGLR